jgi:methionyl-tRNA formyltransferase
LDHLGERKQSEEDLFGAFVRLAPDRSNPISIIKGTINDDDVIEKIVNAAPDLLVAYGPSLIRSALLSQFAPRFLNVHLGLSPYYRGSGTNYWPLVQGQPEYVGATFMHMDKGIDTGRIIHQIRARVYQGDTPHLIGNRLILDVALVYGALIARFDTLQSMPPLPQPSNELFYKQLDFTVESLHELRKQFSGGLVATYLQERQARCAAVPIIENPGVPPLQALMDISQ